MGWGRWVPCFPLSGNPETPCLPYTGQASLLLNHGGPPQGGGQCRMVGEVSKWSNPRASVRLSWWQLQADLSGTSRHLTAGIPSQGKQPLEERLMPLYNKMSATTAQVLWPFLEYCVQCTACMPSSNPYSSPVRGNWGCLKLTVVLLTINTSLTWSHYTN